MQTRSCAEFEAHADFHLQRGVVEIDARIAEVFIDARYDFATDGPFVVQDVVSTDSGEVAVVIRGAAANRPIGARNAACDKDQRLAQISTQRHLCRQFAFDLIIATAA